MAANNNASTMFNGSVLLSEEEESDCRIRESSATFVASSLPYTTSTLEQMLNHYNFCETGDYLLYSLKNKESPPQKYLSESSNGRINCICSDYELVKIHFQMSVIMRLGSHSTKNRNRTST